jgi:hypothetical protein
MVDGFGLVFAGIGTITVMFCWWVDRRVARFTAEDADAHRHLNRSARRIAASGMKGLPDDG